MNSDANRASSPPGTDRRTTRRRLLAAGATLIPAIVTLRPRLALGQASPGDNPNNPLPVLNFQYSTVNYRYGDTQGTTFDYWGVDKVNGQPHEVQPGVYKKTNPGEPDKPKFLSFRNTP